MAMLFASLKYDRVVRFVDTSREVHVVDIDDSEAKIMLNKLVSQCASLPPRSAIKQRRLVREEQIARQSDQLQDCVEDPTLRMHPIAHGDGLKEPTK